MSILLSRQYLSKYASTMPQNQSKWSINGYKAFAFPTKITNCPQFVTSGEIGDKRSQIRKKLAPGVSKLLNRQYLSKYASSMPQHPSKWSMNGYKAFEFASKISKYP